MIEDPVINQDEGAADGMAALESGSRGAKFRERRDIVTGQIFDEADIVRFVIGPNEEVVTDVAAKLPGRGIWVAADRASVDLAVSKGLFARSAKTKALAPKDLSDRVEAALAARVLSMLGLALRTGKLEMGYDKVRAMIGVEPPAWRIAASEATRDGRNKIRMASKAAWNATPLLGCFTARELGAALGRDDITHAAMREGRLANKFNVEARRLEGFRALLPADWETEINDAATLTSLE
ncbi:MAG: RNA-binding protein [Robiginitomaculum sp.]